ncbi:hypothetical protein L1887_38883 [Cichorium endivia]|nr:hypothetical protein L1887_38883 [Cichorium endivia]
MHSSQLPAYGSTMPSGQFMPPSRYRFQDNLPEPIELGGDDCGCDGNCNQAGKPETQRKSAQTLVAGDAG